MIKENRAEQRDFNTDKVERYPRDFLKSILEGRTYEDLQVPTKIRLREVVRKFDDLERLIPLLEKFFANKISVTFTSAHATADLEVPHDLGVVPSEVLMAVPSADARIWRGTKTWTRSNLYLRASAACTTTLYPVV